MGSEGAAVTAPPEWPLLEAQITLGKQTREAGFCGELVGN